MFASSNAKTRRITPDHEEWIPRKYQKRAVKFLLERGSAALFLDPGLGKTSITLEAFDVLRKEGYAEKMLVIAPLRVCQLVWKQEARIWSQFRHLTFTLLHGPNKAKKLKDKSDIFLINPEGIPWLANELWGGKFPFDTVVIDELTKFKNASAIRHKALMPLLKKKTVKRRWGLTGTPIPNGYLNLFGQMKILDDGAALGFYYTHYRNKYFEKDYNGFTYSLRRGAAKAIEECIRPYVLRMSAEDYLEMPPLIEDIISIEMPNSARIKYEEMKRQMIVELEGNMVEAGNAAAVYNKLKQMGNGAVYSGNGILEPRKSIHLHDAKIEALQDLVEELGGTPLLVAYEFNHDLVRLKKAFGRDVPHLGAGVSASQARKIERDWNGNKLPLLFAHPASAGHGLNFQKGNACHIAWFSVTWDYELYDQFIRRIRRQGNKAKRIFNYLLIVKNSIDNLTKDVIVDKGITQDKFLAAMNDEIYSVGKKGATPVVAKNEPEENTMVRKLSRKKAKPEEDEIEEDDLENEEGEDEEDEEDEAPRRTRRLKTKKRRSEPEDEDDEEEDEDEDEDDEEEDEEEKPRRRVRKASKMSSGTKRKLRGRGKPKDPDDEEGEDEDEDEEKASPRKRARKKFSKAVQDKLDQDDEENDEENDDEADQEEEAPPRKRAAKTKSSTTAVGGDVALKGLRVQIEKTLDGECSPKDLANLSIALTNVKFMESKD